MDTHTLSQRIRKHAVRMTHIGKSSHVAAVLSMADIVAVLYGEVLRKRADDPHWAQRDRFILSKGHAGAGVYAALAETGYFPVEELETHYADGSKLSGHVSHKGVPGVEFSTGSLGHGLPVATGMAYAGKLDKKTHRVFVLLGDGECDEGSNWEAILFAAHHALSNLIAVVDYNNMQSLNTVDKTLKLEPFREKWESFGWKTVLVDGHNHNQLKRVLNVHPQTESKPSCVICKTIKGKGVSFMENSVLWHYRSPQGDEYVNALKELGENTYAK